MPAKRYYGVYLYHQGNCKYVLDPNVGLAGNFLKQEACDISLTIMNGSRLLYHEHVTNANQSIHNADFVYYHLGYFYVKQRSMLSVIVSNSPSKHDDLMCKARVVIEEVLTK